MYLGSFHKWTFYTSWNCTKTNISFNTYGWIFWVLIRGPMLCGQGDVYYITSWEAWICPWAWPRCNPCIQKMHVGYKGWMEWGVKGLKWKLNWLMKHFYSTKEKYSHFFQVVGIFTNFLHRHHLDFTYEIIGDQVEDMVNYN
jgi:hypothetical protein